jgi:hypothetical protein
MTRIRKFVAAATLLVMATGSMNNNLEAQDYVTDCGGYGYEESCCSPSLTPYIALGTVVIIAIVALAVRHHHGSHHHSHSCH